MATERIGEGELEQTIQAIKKMHHPIWTMIQTAPFE